MKKAKGKTQKATPRFKRQNFEFWVVVLPFAFYLLSLPIWCAAVVSACPGCKDALMEPGQLGQRLGAARGYALSIGLLLMVPALLIGGIAAMIVREHRSLKQKL